MSKYLDYSRNLKKIGWWSLQSADHNISNIKGIEIWAHVGTSTRSVYYIIL